MAILSIPQLGELRKALAQVFTYIHGLQENNPMAHHIKAPQVPSAFSESLTVHLLRSGLILPHLKSATFSTGGLADVIAIEGTNVTKIEVKATGDKGFQRLGEKDLIADYLVWIHFNLFFKSVSVEPLFVWTLEKPGRFFQKTGILNVDIFKSKAGSALVEHLIAFDDLK